MIGIDHAKYRLRARQAADKLPALSNLCAPHMTPFSKVLREKRDQRDLLQRDLAAAMGCDPSLISGLESGHRGAPGPDLLKRLAEALELSEAEEAELVQAARASDRRLVIDANASLDWFLFLDDLRERRQSMRPDTLRALRAVLKLGDAEGRYRALPRRSDGASSDSRDQSLMA